MEISKIYMQMKEQGMGSYLEKMVSDSVSILERIVLMLYNVLIFLLFIENFQIFENFYPLSIVLDYF